MDAELVCRVCDREVPLHPVTGRPLPHKSLETKGYCGGTDLEPKDDIW